MYLMEIRKVLGDWLSKADKIVIIGVGNPLRKDDAIGLEVIHRLKANVSEHVYLINSETIPEDYIGLISDFKPTHILIIDAALISNKSGVMKFVEDWSDSRIPVLTHALPIQIFCAYLKELTHAKIAMLLIQPKDVDFGEGLSVELKETADMIASYLLNIPVIGKR